MLSDCYLLPAVGIVLALFGFAQTDKSAPEPERIRGKVEWVYDGDTIRTANENTKVRLWGVDAPEIGEPGAEAAKDVLIDLVHGELVSFIVMDTDRYGRLVGRVFLDDGREVNRLLIEKGVAQEYCRYSKGFYRNCPINIEAY